MCTCIISSSKIGAFRQIEKLNIIDVYFKIIIFNIYTCIVKLHFLFALVAWVIHKLVYCATSEAVTYQRCQSDLL